MVTHEDATLIETMPYHMTRLRPLAPVEFYGRAKKRDPPCPAEHCLWHWWKDCAGMLRPMDLVRGGCLDGSIKGVTVYVSHHGGHGI